MIRQILLLASALLCWPAFSQTSLLEVTHLRDDSGCPGPAGAYVGHVIPHVSTLADATGTPFRPTLYYQDGYGPSQRFSMTLCAFTPAGKFIGGSVVKYRGGMRLWFDTYGGTEKHSLTELLLPEQPTPAPGELNFREFQIYVGSPNFSMLEYGIAGNQLQTQAFARIPRTYHARVQSPSASGAWIDGADTVFHISQTSIQTTQPCVVALTLRNEEGQPILIQNLTVPFRGAATADLGKIAPGLSGAVDISRSSGSCDTLYVSRETKIRSNALGGESLSMEVYP